MRRVLPFVLLVAAAPGCGPSAPAGAAGSGGAGGSGGASGAGGAGGTGGAGGAAGRGGAGGGGVGGGGAGAPGGAGGMAGGIPGRILLGDLAFYDVSADGAWIVFRDVIRNKQAQVARRMPGQIPIELANNSAVARFDGTVALGISDSMDYENGTLFAWAPGQSGPTMLDANVRLARAVASPDAMRVAYFTGTGTVSVVRAMTAGGGRQVLAMGSTRGCTRLAYGQGALVAVTCDGSERQSLSIFHDDGMREDLVAGTLGGFALSPDRRKLAWTDGMGLAIRDLQRGAQAARPDPMADADVRWSTDGTFVAYRQVSRIMKVAAGGGMPSMLAANGSGVLAVAPQGTLYGRMTGGDLTDVYFTPDVALLTRAAAASPVLGKDGAFAAWIESPDAMGVGSAVVASTSGRPESLSTTSAHVALAAGGKVLWDDMFDTVNYRGALMVRPAAGGAATMMATPVNGWALVPPTYDEVVYSVSGSPFTGDGMYSRPLP